MGKILDKVSLFLTISTYNVESTAAAVPTTTTFLPHPTLHKPSQLGQLAEVALVFGLMYLERFHSC